jgi:hypothetical protein
LFDKICSCQDFHFLNICFCLINNFSGEGDTVNIAITVADEKQNDPETKKSITEAKEKLKSIDIQVPTEELQKCSAHKPHNLLVH